MQEYLKIETVFNRDTSGSKKLILNDYRNETVKYLSMNNWIWTEKIDGTNIRVHWDGHKVEFGGRTDRAEIPGKLLNYLEETFGTMEAEEMFEQKFGSSDVIFFGEGYGAGINKGGNYRKDVSFILFDVLSNGEEILWLKRNSVEDIAKAFGVDVVPIVGRGTIPDAIRYVVGHPKSTIGTAEMEGVVARPEVDVLDRRGNRVLVKIKWKDFKWLAE